MGQDGRKYRREAMQCLRAVVAEVYSAPRVTAAARRHSRLGMLPGLALDLTGVDEEGVPWDFNDPKQRKKAEALIDFQEPALLIGPPMCTTFSHIQNLLKAKRDPAVVEQELIRARVHLQ